MNFDKLIDLVGNNTIKAVTKEFSVDKVAQTIENEIRKNHIQVIYKLIGFDNSFREWSVDHCNGRSGNSAFGDSLKAVAVPRIKEYIESKIKEPEFIDSLEKNVDKAVKKELKDLLSEYSLQKTIQLMLEPMIKSELEKCIKEVEEELRKQVRERFYNPVDIQPSPNP